MKNAPQSQIKNFTFFGISEIVLYKLEVDTKIGIIK